MGVSDDTGILLFLGIGAVILIGIVVFGLLSSRQKKNAQTRTWTVRTEWIGDQPYLASTDLTQDDKRQEELFRLTYAIGGVLPMTLADENGERVERDLRVSRIGRSLRGGWPQAKLGLTAYFAEWDNSEFPVTFPVKASDKIVSITMDADGIAARDAVGAVVWSSPWSSLLFSNGPDIVLSDGAAHTLRIETPEEHPELEEILIKYGALKQMHF